MANRIKFQNPAMRKYEKRSSPSLLPVIVVIILLALAGHYVFAAEDRGQPARQRLPHVELTRWFELGGDEKLTLDCHPEENPAHFYCRVVREIRGQEAATAALDEKTASTALDHFFRQWPAGAVCASSTGRRSLSWKVAYGRRLASGQAAWQDPQQADRTAAVLALEGELSAPLWR